MIKKLFSRSLSTNISQVIWNNMFFCAFALLDSYQFIREIAIALYTPEGTEPLIINNVQYTLFHLIIDTTHGSFHHVVTIFNSTLIPLFIILIYNLYIIYKKFKEK